LERKKATNKKRYTIATLGSHCSLQVLKGAKDEGFRTLLICEKSRSSLYRRFNFIDDVIMVDNFSEISEQFCQKRLNQSNSIVIPIGTLVAYMSSEQIESINVPFFGNKWILRWESDRNLKQKLMEEAKLKTPKPVKSKNDIERLSIVKLHGAAGGRGYFLAWNKETFEEGARKLVNQKKINSEDDLYIQEYVMGVPAYLQYFYSPITKNIELMGVDRRYESDIDGIGRIPFRQQMGIEMEPSYNVVGNIPIVLRESLLGEVYAMGERFVDAAKRLVPPGMNGPFCLEGVYDRDGNFVTFEFSARIVAGTNLYLDGSPYSGLIYPQPMSMGRRIAHEIKLANGKRRIKELLT
jgi:5-formaminoimidazole-4-carboxamide-1-(beta)-D-ribofuranosyl 5'-monophosphate synthetase